jgi:hypothetical protein
LANDAENQSMAVATADRDLRDLQKVLRQRPKASARAKGQADEGDSEIVRLRPVSLSAIEHALFRSAVEKVLADFRFEHLGRKAEEALWGFVHDCLNDKGADHVSDFVTLHAKEPMALMCYLPIEFLSVDNDVEFAGIHLLPSSDPQIPVTAPAISLDSPVGCVASVHVLGTNYEKMAGRATTAASHALRVLRAALREVRGINDWQLRFRLGQSYAFSNGAGGWSERTDSAYELSLNSDLVTFALAQPLGALPVHPTTDVERKADLAVRWFERARFAGEPIVSLLYLFFALEALLGDRAEGLKAHAPAFRQAMLSHVVTKGFIHPNKTYFLYDEVRSAAVHGEDVPGVGWDTVGEFGWVVRTTLNDFLTFAEAQGFTRRTEVVRALDKHPDWPKLVAWLRARGGEVWDEYLDRPIPPKPQR